MGSSLSINLDFGQRVYVQVIIGELFEKLPEELFRFTDKQNFINLVLCSK